MQLQMLLHKVLDPLMLFSRALLCILCNIAFSSSFQARTHFSIALADNQSQKLYNSELTKDSFIKCISKVPNEITFT